MLFLSHPTHRSVGEASPLLTFYQGQQLCFYDGYENLQAKVRPEKKGTISHYPVQKH